MVYIIVNNIVDERSRYCKLCAQFVSILRNVSVAWKPVLNFACKCLTLTGLGKCRTP